MNFEIANRGRACSSLILGGFQKARCIGVGKFSEGEFKKFLSNFQNAMTFAESPESTVPTWSVWHREENYRVDRQVLDGHRVSDFAFIFATTLDEDPDLKDFNQRNSELYLEKLGFKKVNDKPVHNTKNDTYINSWVGEVSVVLDNFENFYKKKDVS